MQHIVDALLRLGVIVRYSLFIDGRDWRCGLDGRRESAVLCGGGDGAEVGIEGVRALNGRNRHWTAVGSCRHGGRAVFSGGGAVVEASSYAPPVKALATW